MEDMESQSPPTISFPPIVPHHPRSLPMSPTIVSSPFVPPTDTANVQGPVHPPSASYQFGIVFWPILFGG